MSSTIVGCSENAQVWKLISKVIGLGNGGTPVVLYGLIGVSFINLFLAATLSELAAAWPSAGGQYVWASKLGGPRVAFAVGWATIFEWIAIVGMRYDSLSRSFQPLTPGRIGRYHLSRGHLWPRRDLPPVVPHPAMACLPDLHGGEHNIGAEQPVCPLQHPAYGHRVPRLLNCYLPRYHDHLSSCS